MTIAYVRFRTPPEAALLVADAMGLALFTIGGAQIAEQQHLPAVIVVIMGALTGGAGGLLRDVLTGDTPLLFLPSEPLYATASIIGVVVYLTVKAQGLGPTMAAACGMTAVARLRLAAIFWKLRLPVFDLGKHEALRK